jgi:hypothetical protein
MIEPSESRNLSCNLAEVFMDDIRTHLMKNGYLLGYRADTGCHTIRKKFLPMDREMFMDYNDRLRTIIIFSASSANISIDLDGALSYPDQALDGILFAMDDYSRVGPSKKRGCFYKKINGVVEYYA